VPPLPELVKRATSFVAIIVRFGWNCKIEAGIRGFTGPPKAGLTASILSPPFTRSNIVRASMIVPMPIVIPYFGTSDKVLKSELFAFRVHS
jgi:hypothetical protein